MPSCFELFLLASFSVDPSALVVNPLLKLLHKCVTACLANDILEMGQVVRAQIQFVADGCLKDYVRVSNRDFYAESFRVLHDTVCWSIEFAVGLV